MPRIRASSSYRQRPRANQHLDLAPGHVIGVDVGGSNLRVALADMKGIILGRWSSSTKGSSSPQMVVRQIQRGVKHLLKETSVPRSSLLAISAGVAGVANREKGVVLLTSYLRGWRHAPLGQLLESTFGIPAVIENDVRLGAIAEHWIGSAQGISDFVFLAIGTGIAAGIFVNGCLVQGADSVAGEIGYMIVPETPEAPASPGMPGALESVIGGEGIKQQWLGSYNGRVRSTQDVTATGIFLHALSGNRTARSVLERTARILAYAIYNISLVLNSSLFVLGGGVGMSKPLVDATTRRLQAYSQPVRPKLVLSSLGRDAQLLGAIRLAIEKAALQA